MSRTTTRDMTSGSPAKHILHFSLPMLVGNIFQQLYNMVDSAVVGKYVSKDALAAVGATGSITYFVFSLVFGLCVGVSIVTAQYFGAKDYERIRKGVATAVYVIGAAALIVGVGGFLASRSLLELLNTPASLIDEAEVYLKLTFVGIIGIAGYNGMAAMLRALGDSITPLIFLIIASIINVVLDLVFVINFGWGVPGVAIATIIAQLISAIGCIVYAMIKVDILRISFKELHPDKEILKKFVRLGLPVAIQNSFISISMMALQSVVNGFEEVIMAATTAVNRIEQLIMQPSMSLGAAVSSFTGQNIGANRIDRAKKGMRSATFIILIFSLLMMPAIYFGSEFIMRLFTKKEDVEVVIYGMQGIRISCFFYFFVGMIFLTRNFLSGAGDIRIPMYMGFSEVIFRVALAFYLSSKIGFHGIFWATALTWFLTSMIGIARVLSGKWMNKSIVRQL